MCRGTECHFKCIVFHRAFPERVDCTLCGGVFFFFFGPVGISSRICSFILPEMQQGGSFGRGTLEKFCDIIFENFMVMSCICNIHKVGTRI